MKSIEKNVAVKFVGEGVKDTDLGFLRECKVQDVFACILALATSNRDIARLNNLLPSNCQVFGSDIASLEKVRSIMYGGSPPNSNVRPSDEVCQQMLTAMLGKKSLCGYYFWATSQGRDECEMSGIPYSEIIFSVRERQGHGGEHFHSTLFGEPIDIGIYISREDRSKVGVRFTIWEKEISCDFAHSICANSALMSAPHSGFRTSSSVKGRETDFWLVFDSEPFMDLIKEEWKHSEEKPSYGKVLVVQEGFIEFLTEKLTEAGFTSDVLGPISPILPVPDSDE